MYVLPYCIPQGVFLCGPAPTLCVGAGPSQSNRVISTPLSKTVAAVFVLICRSTVPVARPPDGYAPTLRTMYFTRVHNVRTP